MTQTTRKFYVELDYTLPEEIAVITIGLHRQAVKGSMDHPVHLFNADAGLLASVTVEMPEDWDEADFTATDALDLAKEELAFAELEKYLPADVDANDLEPWRHLIIDSDLMAANVLESRIQPTRPAQAAKGDA